MSGRSEHVDVSMLDAMVYQLNYHPIRYKFADLFYERIGNRVAGAGVSGAYRCKDGHIVIAGGGDTNWQRLAKVIGQPELVDDPRYAQTPKRWENHDDLDVLIEEWSCELTVDEALAALREEDLVVGPVYELPDIFEDEHLKARKMLVEVEHPLHGALTVPGVGSQDAELEARGDRRGGPAGRGAQRLRRQRAARPFRSRASLPRRERDHLPQGARRASPVVAARWPTSP